MLEMMAFFPHPPIVLPAVGGEESAKVEATYQAMNKLAEEIASVSPDFIVAITPHGHIFRDAIGITALEQLVGNLGQFGAPEVKVSLPLDREAVQNIIEKCQRPEFCCVPLDQDLLRKYKLPLELDHGLVIPLYLITQAGWRGSLVPINMAFFPYEELYHFGTTLTQALETTAQKWVLLISGDLSHRLLPQAPNGYSPQGAVFDEILRQAIREGDVKRVIHLDKELIEEAGECGLRPFIMGLGAFDGYEIQTEELSYEGPFGVGYFVAKIVPGTKNSDRELVATLYQERQHCLKERRDAESPLVSLARQSIKEYLATGRYPVSPLEPKGAAAELLGRKAGAFVSLKKHGQLRGCIGTIEPSYPNLAQEIMHNAVAAAVQDPRFEPLEIEELDEVSISVDVLSRPEKINSQEQLDPQVYGVIVSKGSHRGLLLPDLPGIITTEEQVKIAKEKAGLANDEKVELERFRVERYL